MRKVSQRERTATRAAGTPPRGSSDPGRCSTASLRCGHDSDRAPSVGTPADCQGTPSRNSRSRKPGDPLAGARPFGPCTGPLVTLRRAQAPPTQSCAGRQRPSPTTLIAFTACWWQYTEPFSAWRLQVRHSFALVS